MISKEKLFLAADITLDRPSRLTGWLLDYEASQSIARHTRRHE